MTEASWGEATKTPEIDWAMSASLRDVVREGEDLPEVASLLATVRAWTELDAAHRDGATLTPEYPILIDGIAHQHFTGAAIALLAERLPD